MTLIELLIVVSVIGIVAAVLIGSRGCVGVPSDQEAVNAAGTFGFTGVQVNDSHDWLPSRYGCGDDDAIAFDMTGKNPLGRQVDFKMCCGSTQSNGKGCTLRVR
jgi:prepilin-type N-terminal cleavage/methylation domain-containing protein